MCQQSLHHVIAVYYIIATGEASSSLARFDGVRYRYRTSDACFLPELYIEEKSAGPL